MDDHTVAVDTAQTPTALAFAEVFNVAVPFIDRHLAEGRGAKVAIRDTHGDVTYAVLAANVNRAGNALATLGLNPGDRVLMVVKDCPLFFYLFWGAIKAGFVPVPLNTLLRAPDYRVVIDNARAACIVWSPEFADEIAGALAGASYRPAHALPAEGEGDTFAARLAEGLDALAPAPAAAADPAFWLYTSGSTGTPKGAVHRHRDMVVTSQYFGVDTLGITENDTHFSAAKLFFAYGLGNAMTFPLWTGGTAVLSADRPTPASTFATIEAFRPTSTTACRRSMPRSCRRWRARRRTFPACGSASRPASRCRRRCSNAGAPPPGSTSSTGSERPRACTSSSPTVRVGWRPGPAARSYRATRRAWSTMTGTTWRPARPATC